ncbi:alpha/beta fold hydrolase [Planctomonas deserti]|uniref:alpha/beta fold hydrolase n=1 Tax=Planctomonas deserti TaxID=2144185 RepID=UPI000D3A4FB1|nr:alpha/beta fold hydrolase [Planctomonas deserti]
MPTLDVAGATLYYETHGHVSAPALLLIHAGVASLRMWDAIVPSLEGDHHVIRFDTRGFGGTRTADGPYSDRDDARALLDHLGVAEATVVGNSRGGRIALDLALETPERVSGLVLVDAAIGGFPEVALTDAERELAERMDEAEDERDWLRLADLEVEFWCVGPGRSGDDVDPAFLRLAHELNRANAAHATEQPSPVPLEPPAYGRLGELDFPALVTVGAFDASPALRWFEYARDGIPGAEHEVFPGSAHLPSLEQPAEFSARLREWLGLHGL